MSYKLVLSIFSWMHHRIFYLMLLAYALSAIFPLAGTQIHSIHFSGDFFGFQAKVFFPSILLSAMLIIAGYGLKFSEIQTVGRSWRQFLAVLFIYPLIPLFLMGMLIIAASLWHDQKEIYSIIIAIVLVISMPIASSSAVWTMNNGGNTAMTVSLIIGSTLLCPFVEPVVLQSVARITAAEYSASFLDLLQASGISFMAFSVALPVCIGFLLRMVLPSDWPEKIRPSLKGFNVLILLLLNYSNASLSLPGIIQDPDYDFYGLIICVTICFMAAGFAGAYWLGAKAFGMERQEIISTTFSLGMRNNGAALTIAAVTLSGFPEVMLSIIALNLWQQLGASFFESKFFGKHT